MGLIGMLFMIVWFPFAWLRSKLTGKPILNIFE